MKYKVVSLALKAVMAILPITMLATTANAGTYKVLYNFRGTASGGGTPLVGLIMDKDGNLYGSTQYPNSGGTSYIVFQLSPTSSGTWTEKAIYSPYGLVFGFVFDASGNLYLATQNGPTLKIAGTVAELIPSTDGTWKEKLVHSFAGPGPDVPRALVIDGAGHLYGTTFGGSNGYGEVFELEPAESGGWKETVLHNFGLGEGGVFPDSLMIDAAGSLYGTALEGGPYQEGAPDVTESDNDKGGTAFKLTPQGGDAWTETVLYSFGKGASGTQPVGGLVFDNSGNLYGAAESGGRRDCPNGCGTLFELSPKEDGGWAAETLHEFKTQATGGYSPSGNLIFDAAGNFYGTTSSGGVGGGGELFEFTPTGDGGWEHTVVHDFGSSESGGGKDGSGPLGTMAMDSAGNIYGVAEHGGSHGYGTVWEYIP